MGRHIRVLARIRGKSIGFTLERRQVAMTLRKRYHIELFLHRLKRCRAGATRYDKTARNVTLLLKTTFRLISVELPTTQPRDVQYR